MQELDRIKARLDGTTPAPWTVDRNFPFSDDLVGIFQPERREYILQVDVMDDDKDEPSDEDVSFIAAARTDVPKLLTAVEAVLKLCYASDDGSEYEHTEGCQGEAECSACWAVDIRAHVEAALQ